ncbi:MAG TPA: Xaa-Pro peptidase family protein [Candidatus Lokiarchaeia archaeon]|nr:Xaa-Pro peptidase family protein [Candidatus Lokiarchaeia archaeon]
MQVDDQKRQRAKAIMEQQDIDVIISRFTENVLYFTNVWPVTGWGIAIMSRDGDDPILFLPGSEMDFTSRATTNDIRPYENTSLEAIEEMIRELGISGKKVGLELAKEGLASSHLGYEVAFPSKPTFDAMARALPDCTIVDATPAIDEMRECKTDNELAQLKLVNDLTYYGLDAAAELLHADDFTEMQIATECEKAIMDSITDYEGIDFVRAFAFVMAGPNGIKASLPYNISTAYRCKKGEYVMLELNTQVNGFWSDLTRTWVCGRNPTKEQEDQERAVNGAIEAAVKTMRPNNTWRGAYDASRAAIVESGFGAFHTPFLGHGIGVKLHEKVPMMTGSTDESFTFQHGHCCSVEPGLYFEGKGALRFERNVAILDLGTEFMDEFPCSL